MKNRGKFIFYLLLSVIVIGVKLANYESLELMELRLQDALFDFKQSTSPSTSVALITIDEVSLKSIGPWPWKKEVVADLVAAVGSGEPRTTLIDFPLSENSASGAGIISPKSKLPKSGKQNSSKDYTSKSHKKTGTGPSIVAEQFEWMDNVTIAYSVIPSQRPNDTVVNTPYLYRNALITNSDLSRLQDNQALSVSAVALPDRDIISIASRLGFSYSRVDADEVLRTEPLVMNFDGYYYPSAALSAATHYLGVSPENIKVNGGESIELLDRTIPTNNAGEMLLNFPAEGSGFEIFSATDILNERVKPEIFKDRVVIVTLATGANTEYYKSPISEELPHYMKTAVAIDNIINEEYLRRADSHLGWYILALALIGLISSFALQMISSLYRIIVVALALVALANVNYFLFNSFHLMANSLYVALQLVLFLIATPLTSFNYSFITDRFRKKTEEELFEELSPEFDESDLKSASRGQQEVRDSKANESFIGAGANRNTAAGMGETMALPGAGVASSDTNSTIALGSKQNAADISPDDANKTAILGEKQPEAPAPHESYGELTGINLDTSLSSDSSDNSGSSDSSDHSNDPGVIQLDDSPLTPASGLDRTSVYNANEEVKGPEQVPVEEDISLFGDGIIRVDEPEESAVPPSTPTPPPTPPLAPTPAPVPEPAPEPMPVAPKMQETDGNLGRYKLQGILGKGAMGLVYRGVDPVINRTVALKTIRLDFLTDPDEIAEMKERLFLEAQAAGKLSHPNIVTIYDVGEEGTTQYIAMEYLEGQTLEDMIKRKVNFNFKILAKMIYQISSALQYAHDQGIVHRDIKPANIMVLPDYSIKVMDFGIARIESSSMTKTGVAMGTPNYISPEQLSGGKIDGRSDIFSMGVMFYEMLLGQRPFAGANLTALIYSIMNKEPETPSKVNSRIPPIFDMVIGKSLQKDPAKRYQKASDVAAALSDFVQSFATR